MRFTAVVLFLALSLFCTAHSQSQEKKGKAKTEKVKIDTKMRDGKADKVDNQSGRSTEVRKDEPGSTMEPMVKRSADSAKPHQSGK
jgi:hypothetical protein